MMVIELPLISAKKEYKNMIKTFGTYWGYSLFFRTKKHENCDDENTHKSSNDYNRFVYILFLFLFFCCSVA